MSSFAERLAALRAEKGMTLEEIGNAIGVSRGTVNKYEHGMITNIPPDRVHKIARIFGVTRPYLMGWTDDREVNPSENLDVVAERLSEQRDGYWRPLPKMDCTTAATQAARALVKFGISRAPVYPHKVLQQSQSATMVSFADADELERIIRYTRLETFRQANDMVMSAVHETQNGLYHYIFAVNREAPIGKVRLALSVELGHIYMGHQMHRKDMQNDALCFAMHFAFPRALIRLLEERGFKFTKESFQRIFGDCEWSLDMMMAADAVHVSPELNRMVKEQFVPHVDMLEDTGILGMPAEGPRIELAGYMAGYED